METPNPELFQTMLLPHCGWVDRVTPRYRLFSDRDLRDSVVIEAGNASEALRLSGLEHCYRIERIVVEYGLMAERDLMTEKQQVLSLSPIEIRRRHDPIVDNAHMHELLEKAGMQASRAGVPEIGEESAPTSSEAASSADAEQAMPVEMPLIQEEGEKVKV